MKSIIKRIIVDEDFKPKSILGKTVEQLTELSDKNQEKYKKQFIFEFLGNFNESGKLITIDNWNMHHPVNFSEIFE